MTELEAHEGFLGWISAQAELHRATDIGLAPTEAETLFALAEAVVL